MLNQNEEIEYKEITVLEDDEAEEYDDEEEEFYTIEEIIEVLQENDTYIEKCLKSLMYSFIDIYTEIHCKYVDKIVLSNNKKVFVYDYETDNFKVSDLPYNQEEEYIVIILADYDLENRIPFFNYFNYTTTNGNLKTLNKFIRQKLYLNKKYEKMKENFKNERKRTIEEFKQSQKET